MSVTLPGGLVGGSQISLKIGEYSILLKYKVVKVELSGVVGRVYIEALALY